MWEVLVVYLAGREAIKQERTHYPPLLGDHVVMGSGTYVVIQRAWKEHHTEQRMLDVTLRKVKKS